MRRLFFHEESIHEVSRRYLEHEYIHTYIHTDKPKPICPPLFQSWGHNQPAGFGEEDFLRVFTIYGHGGHLGHVTSIMSSDFYFLVPESFHKKFVSDW